MLSGVGVPDLRGSQSKGTFYTQDRTVVCRGKRAARLPRFKASGFGVGVDRARDRPAQYEDVARIGHLLRSARASRSIGAQTVIHTGGSPSRLKFRKKGWSEWVAVQIQVLLAAIGERHYAILFRQLEPHWNSTFPRQLRSRGADVPNFAPADYAKELSDKIGLFSTLGMRRITMA